jgi:hypothetical protein
MQRLLGRSLSPSTVGEVVGGPKASPDLKSTIASLESSARYRIYRGHQGRQQAKNGGLPEKIKRLEETGTEAGRYYAEEMSNRAWKAEHQAMERQWEAEHQAWLAKIAKQSRERALSHVAQFGEPLMPRTDLPHVDPVELARAQRQYAEQQAALSERLGDFKTKAKVWLAGSFAVASGLAGSAYEKAKNYLTEVTTQQTPVEEKITTSGV